MGVVLLNKEEDSWLWELEEVFKTLGLDEVTTEKM